ncbi:glycosyltransferase family 2 protein [Desulfonatronum sp. SC1]|uniref:glycosyltransferase family 2 protein n=1 Tax=Desulfonatronum sp. SC1 TaxID=2109626 RepID=UPI000D3217E9|nr:glycosyltransferase family 2 protein [Desulfonatronum sp. SC1]PTN37568.1 glycosyltransferase [Desulfonatronum sp. SC1]
MTELSVVVPLYNEEGNVVELHREIKDVCEANGYTYEIILVDDGSEDETLKRAKECSPAKIIRFRRNFGQTAAFDAGIKQSRYRYIVTMDGDRQNDPRDIPRMIAFLEEHDYDVVSGWRKNRKDNFSKRFFSNGAKMLRDVLVKDRIHDSGCALKVYRRECFENINLFGEMHRFIPALLKIKGFTVGEVEVNHRPRVAGVSKYNWKRAMKGFVDMVSVWFWNKYAVRPLHLLGGAGMVMLGIGLIFSLYTVILFLKGQNLSNTVWPLLSAFSVITGLQLFVSGLLADMMSKLYYEKSKDKSYIIREVIER